MCRDTAVNDCGYLATGFCECSCSTSNSSRRAWFFSSTNSLWESMHVSTPQEHLILSMSGLQVTLSRQILQKECPHISRRGVCVPFELNRLWQRGQRREGMEWAASEKLRLRDLFRDSPKF